MIDADLHEALQQSPLFAGLEEAAATSLSHAAERIRVPVGAVLIQQGDASDSLYVVVRGRFVVERMNEQGTMAMLNEISAGEVLGEMAMLSSEPRAATVRAVRDSDVIEVSRAAFERLAATYPELMRRLASLLAGRLRSANAPARPREHLRTIAMIPHDDRVSLTSFAAKVHAALASYGETEMLTSASMAESDQRIEHALRDIAASDRAGCVTLLVGDAQDVEWNATILAQADLILVVALASAPPEAGAVEATISQMVPARRELVLLHAPGTEPSGTTRWLQGARFTRHHHIRIDDDAHAHRLARRLAGCSIGLVLGGGGARGFAHIGVYRALVELGIPIDRVGGTSMGSIMAAEVALGWDADRMHERTREAFRKDPLAWDNTLPFVSKITCNKVVRLFQNLLGDARAEDCWLPYFSISCSLTDACTVTHRTGALWQCVRASSALPGLGPPVIQGGKFLVDGAILDNLPAEVLAEEGMGPVIAVNVSPAEDIGTTREDNYALSGWRILWERLRGRPWALQYPNAMFVIQRTVLLGSVAMAERMKQVASLYMHVPVGDFEMFKWSMIDPIVDVGYDTSTEVIAAFARELRTEGRLPG